MYDFLSKEVGLNIVGEDKSYRIREAKANLSFPCPYVGLGLQES